MKNNKTSKNATNKNNATHENKRRNHTETYENLNNIEIKQKRLCKLTKNNKQSEKKNK